MYSTAHMYHTKYRGGVKLLKRMSIAIVTSGVHQGVEARKWIPETQVAASQLCKSVINTKQTGLACTGGYNPPVPKLKIA